MRVGTALHWRQTCVLYAEPMERFPRGTLPPTAWVDLMPGPNIVAAPPSTIDHSETVEAGHAFQSPRGSCDLASMCPTCNTLMQPEHAHYRCMTCGYRDSCCF